MFSILVGMGLLTMTNPRYERKVFEKTELGGLKMKKKQEILLETKNLTKIFPGIIALNRVNFDLRYGEVHGIVGENGAGKSTFCNVVTGIQVPDEGTVIFEGRELKDITPNRVIQMGIRMVYQERNLVPYLTGVENICLNGESKNRLGILKKNEARQRVEEIKGRYNIDINTDIPVAELSSSQQQTIEIIRAILYKPKMLILDEPTSSLSEKNSEVLFEIMKRLKAEGVGIIYISHKLEEVFSLCDRISVFRDGKLITTKESSEIDRKTCINLMADREIESRYPEIISHVKDEKAMEIVDVCDTESLLKNINLHINKGEVLGLYGLVGAGRTELAELIFGIRKTGQGQITLYRNNGKTEIEIRDSVNDRIRKGIYMLPEDRIKSGLFGTFNLMQNFSIACIQRVCNRLKTIVKKKEKDLATDVVQSSKIELKFTSFEQNPMSLSGGNKQKVLIGRMLLQDADVIILDEPTRGIDVGTKYQIYELIRSLAEEGKSIIFISSEMPELLGVCDRLYVMKDGKITGELDRAEFDQEKVLSYCF